jgi:tartrate dehydrogenase/decarboxylase/D-malate dehydrogenase
LVSHQLLEHFGYEAWAQKLIASIEQVLTEKEVLPADLGGTAKTQEVGEAVIQALRTLH